MWSENAGICNTGIFSEFRCGNGILAVRNGICKLNGPGNGIGTPPSIHVFVEDEIHEKQRFAKYQVIISQTKDFPFRFVFSHFFSDSTVRIFIEQKGQNG